MESNNEYELKEAGVTTGFFILKNKIRIRSARKEPQRTTENTRSNYDILDQNPTSYSRKESVKNYKESQRTVKNYVVEVGGWVGVV